MAKRNPIVHIEWRSKNSGRLKDFYRSVFRWKFDETMPGYLLADTGAKDVGAGIMQIDAGASVSEGVVSFIEADDLAGVEAAIREAGGNVVSSAQALPGWGRFSLFTDPDGNPLGLWQSEASVKAEEKAAKKAEKARAKAAAKAAPKAAQPASDAKHADESKAAKKAEKLRKKAERKAEKAVKLAAKAKDTAPKVAKKSKAEKKHKGDH